MADFNRSPSRFVLAGELKNTTISYQEGEGQFATLHTVTPTGCDAHRVILIGAVTEKEDIGSDDEYWRLRIVDPTGSMLVYAGKYQPEAMLAAAQIDVPDYVAVIGKVRLYTTDDGTTISSINAESIIKVTSLERDQFLYFATLNLMTRLLEPDSESKAVKIAAETYQVDKSTYFQMAEATLNSLMKTEDELKSA